MCPVLSHPEDASPAITEQHGDLEWSLMQSASSRRIPPILHAHVCMCARACVHVCACSAPCNFTRSVGVCVTSTTTENRMTPSRGPFPLQLSPCPSRAPCTRPAFNLLRIFTISSFQNGIYGESYCRTPLRLAFFLWHDPLEVHPRCEDAEQVRFLWGRVPRSGWGPSTEPLTLSGTLGCFQLLA